jgi:hypothetical protein
MLHRFSLIHRLGRLRAKLSLVRPVKRNIGLGAAIERPTLLHCAESAELDLDLLADHFRRGELFPLRRRLNLIAMLTLLDIVLRALVVLVILLLLLAVGRATVPLVAVLALVLLWALIAVLALLPPLLLRLRVVLAALYAVETAVVLVAIEFARAVVREHFSDVDFWFTLKVHDAIVCLVVHVQEDVHITEQ